jgi:hypothetical protein
MWVQRVLFRRGGLLACAAALMAGTALAAGPFVEPEAVAIQTFAGEQSGDGFGWVAENIGDITGDGVNDFITSAPFQTAGNPFAGRAYVFSGKGGPPLNTPSGTKRGELFGWSASRAGDVNHDNVPDYVVGGPGPQSIPTQLVGRAVVYSGADHRVLHELTGVPGEAFGASVTGAGDVNGDGYGDLIVGAPRANVGFQGAGRIVLFSGRDGTELWTRNGRNAGANLGSAVGLVGDVNDDGVPDVVAGSSGAGGQQKGEAYVFSGADGRVLHVLRPAGPAATPSTFGVFFASGAGDVNADGVPDVFVGDYAAPLRGVGGTGRAYVYSGADGSRLYIFGSLSAEGVGPGRGVGDVNGDGYGDLFIASWTASDGAPNGGKATLYSGRNGAPLRTITGAVAGEFLGVDALSAGDVNGDSLADYILTTGNGGIEHVYIVAGIR